MQLKLRRVVGPAVFAFTTFAAQQAMAAAQGLPWETPLQTIQNSLTGPVAIALSIIAIMMAGAVLLFGGEINEFARRLIMVVLVVAMIAGAVSIFNTLFTAPGASIGSDATNGTLVPVLVLLALVGIARGLPKRLGSQRRLAVAGDNH